MRDASSDAFAGACARSTAAGTHLLAWLTDVDGRPLKAGGSFNRDVARAAADEDLVVFPLSRYCLEPPERDALVLGYGGLTPRRIAMAWSVGAHHRAAPTITSQSKVDWPRRHQVALAGEPRNTDDDVCDGFAVLVDSPPPR